LDTLRVLGGEAGEMPELKNVGGFRCTELFDQGGFEFRVIEVDPVFDQIHEPDQQGGVTLLQAAEAGDFQHRQRQPEQRLRGFSASDACRSGFPAQYPLSVKTTADDPPPSLWRSPALIY
jgi:hypothetical protein